MRLLYIFVFLLIATSCEKQDLCDLSQYPSAPYGNPDDTIYGENYVRYLYVCFNESGYNKIYTYSIEGECWEVNVEEDYNWNCP
jgi:hypothetical protein